MIWPFPVGLWHCVLGAVHGLISSTILDFSPGLTGNKSKSDSWTVQSLPGLVLHLSVPVLIISPRSASVRHVSTGSLKIQITVGNGMMARFPLLTTNLSTAARLPVETGHSQPTSTMFCEKWLAKEMKDTRGVVKGTSYSPNSPRVRDSGGTETENTSATNSQALSPGQGPPQPLAAALSTTVSRGRREKAKKEAM
ncbi:hypothetical protein QBC45DRAFT_470867 [Copromyces sp. CBS 386.78]|nr:hypothetical protein QBC45DRAFT_470867 [Copromyces sp. CBS 386.78]